ncbi:uncharacterized protein LOC121793604 [Salvia splendens]|uniref:uncharacterized protein LOC121793604 n=1 Tax=Salvia splendens TaxID=180675 RepID=UPI001C2596F5|nr:uncharacterized protein LOC121793604 [Salvia splendens]
MDNDDKFKLPPIYELKSMPLLRLRPVNAESFLKLWESRMSRAATADKEKMKASHIPINTFVVGNWKRESTHKGNLTAKIYYAKKKLVWEFLDGQLKSKMEVSWSDITAIETGVNPDKQGWLRIQLAKPPLFFREIEPQPRKHTIWEKAEDFTYGQALLCRRHTVLFPAEEFDEHYEKLMLNDAHLAGLNRRTFPAHEFPYFYAVFPLQNTPLQLQQQPVLRLHQNSNHPTTSLNSPIVMPSKRKFGHEMQHPHQHQGPLFPSQQNFDRSQQKHRRPTAVLFHQSLNSTVTTPARNNGVVALSGNQISNEATLVDSSQQNQLIDPQQQYSFLQQHSAAYNEMAIPSMKIPSSWDLQNQLRVRHQYSSPRQHSEHNEMATPYMNAPSSSVQENQKLVHQQEYPFHQQHSEIPNSLSHPQHFEIWSSSPHQQHSEIPNSLSHPQHFESVSSSSHQQHSEIPCSSVQQNQFLVPQQHSEIPSSSVQNGSATGEHFLADAINMLENDPTWDDGGVRCYAHSIIGCFNCSTDT